MRRLRSITLRIIALHIVTIAVTAAILPIALKLAFDSVIGKLQSETLSDQTEWLAQHLQRQPDGRITLNLPAGLRGLFSSSYGRYTYAILDQSGRVLSSSNPDNSPVFPVDSISPGEPGDIQIRTVQRGKETIEGIVKDVLFDGERISIQLGEDLAHRDVVLDDVTSQLLRYVVLVTLPILLVLLLADIIIVRGATMSLRRASAHAREISPLRTDVRLPTGNTPEEILPLVDAVNQALDRLDKGFARQRQFTADVAHELRTPLAVLRTRIETLQDRDVANLLMNDVRVMSRVVNQTLELAEIESLLIDPTETTELNEVCREVAELIAPLALQQGKSIALKSTDDAVWVKGNPDALYRAVRNLVENATRHTKAGTTAEIVIDATGSVSVLDKGEGISPQIREVIFQRFGPRDQQRTGGAGLGLAIVKGIVESYGGNITVENRVGGGARFTLHFQLADGAAINAKGS